MQASGPKSIWQDSQRCRQRGKVVRKMLLATFNTGSDLLAFPSCRPTGNSGQALLSPCTQMAVLCFYFENVVYVSGSLWGNRSCKWWALSKNNKKQLLHFFFFLKLNPKKQPRIAGPPQTLVANKILPHERRTDWLPVAFTFLEIHFSVSCP